MPASVDIFKPDGSPLIDQTKRLTRFVASLTLPGAEQQVSGSWSSNELTTGTPFAIIAGSSGGFIPGFSFSGNTFYWDWGFPFQTAPVTVFVCVF